MPLRDIVVIGIILGSVPYVLRKPWIGIILWSWISYMNPHRLCWSFAYDFPVAAVVAGALLLGIMLSPEKHRLPNFPNIIGVWILFLVWMNVTTLFALNPEWAHYEWNRTMKIQLITFCTMLLITSRYRIHMLVWTIVASIGFYGVKGGIWALGTGLKWSVKGPPDSFIHGNNEIGFALCMIIPLMRYLQLQMTKTWHRHAMTAAMIFCLMSVLTTYSRGAFITIIALGATMIWKSRQRHFLILIGIAAIPVMLALLPERWSERMSTIENYQEDRSAMGRINAWWFAWNLAKDRPILGGGYRAFTRSLFVKYAPDPKDFHDAHSIYFEILAEQGFPGLFLFLTLFFSAYVIAGRIVTRSRGSPELKWATDLGSMLQVSLVAYGVGGAFLGLAYFDLPYHLIALSLLTMSVVEQELAKRGKEVEGPREPGLTGVRSPQPDGYYPSRPPY